MIKRVVEIGSECQLSVAYGQLMIRRKNPLDSPAEAEGEVIGKVPLDDLGVLVLDNAMITYTLQLLQQCAERNVAVILCDNKHLPSCLMQPLAGHSLHSRTLAAQMAVSEPTKKRLWQEIIIGKIKAQAQTLTEAGVKPAPVLKCAENVKSGDADNRESQAAALYWKLLFGDTFRRNSTRPSPSQPSPIELEEGESERKEQTNALLNYGYAVVRASVARSVVGTGLHPAIGLHHHNQYDAFCLADDLMEPFRPAVDLMVWKMLQSPTIPAVKGGEMLTKESKRKLLGILESKWSFENKEQPFMVAVQLFAAAVKNALISGRKRLAIPRSIHKGSGR